MLVDSSAFREVALREVTDTKTAAEVVLATQLDDRAAVDDIADKAVQGGAQEVNEAFEQDGMYTGIWTGTSSTYSRLYMSEAIRYQNKMTQ